MVSLELKNTTELWTQWVDLTAGIIITKIWAEISETENIQ